MGLLPVIAKECGRLDTGGGNADQCVCHRRHGRRTAGDAAVVASRTAQCADFRWDLHRPGSLFIIIAPDYTTLLLSRIITSLNHGAFFGLGSVVAASVVPKHKQASAVATMFMGLTIANIGGVPAATWLGETIGWRMSFLATAGLGLLAMVSLWFSLPKGSAGERPDVKKEAFCPAPPVLSRVADHRAGRRGDVYAVYLHFASAQYADPLHRCL